MRRTLATVATIATIAALGLGQVAALYTAVNAHGYGSDNTQNAGWVMDLPAGHWCGLETRGTPGLFCDVS